MLIKLNLRQRVSVLNELGEFESTKNHINVVLPLVDKLGITKEEAEDPNLKLEYDQATGTFNYDVDYDKYVELEIPNEIVTMLEERLNVKLA